MNGATLLNKLLPLGVFLLRLLLLTLRVRVDDQSGVIKNSPKFPLIYVFWHNRILIASAVFLRKYPPTRKGIYVLTSPSKDGEILAQVVAGLGMGSVRGSSSRRGSRALLECIGILTRREDLAITPDGPRGPRYHLGPGLLLLSQQTPARIQLVHIRCSHCIQLKTWDGFLIPLPFARLDVMFPPYETISASLTDEEFEQERQRIEQLLTKGTES